MNRQKKIAIVGGGAAGVFAAITCAEINLNTQIVVFEKSRQFLSKVRISGGGRCNVTHSCFDPRILVNHYPRGTRELLGPFHSWQPKDTIQWFQSKGVELKTEADGRMFPTTDDSKSIVDCLLDTAKDTGVKLLSGTGVASATRTDDQRFAIVSTDGQHLIVDEIILTQGGSRSEAHYKLATDFGHSLIPPVPSLFSFHISDPRIRDLPGLSVQDVCVSYAKKKLQHRGPLLVTHEGMSGPAILKLSAFGARTFHALDYRFDIRINWLGEIKTEQALEKIEHNKQSRKRKLVTNACPFEIPSRLWRSLTIHSGIPPDTQWSQVSKHSMRKLAEELSSGIYSVNGKSMNKEEFVTAGGISLKEIDFKSMESRRVPGLRFAGEFIDVDGVTGGFNFQAA